MDRLIFTAMSGAKTALQRQDAVAHNLANATSSGYKAAAESFRAVPVQRGELRSRVFSVETSGGSDFSSGAIRTTGKNLDIAIQGSGWIALQLPDGTEAYSRNGSLMVGADGTLQTRNGIPVAGTSGPLQLPPDTSISVGRDGTITATPSSGDRANALVVGQIKTVDPEPASMVRGQDGLFRLAAGQSAETDANVTILSGALEESNVNVVDQMVQMIAVSRQFELQTKMIQSAEANDKAAQQILSRV